MLKLHIWLQQIDKTVYTLIEKTCKTMYNGGKVFAITSKYMYFFHDDFV